MFFGFLIVADTDQQNISRKFEIACTYSFSLNLRNFFKRYLSLSFVVANSGLAVLIRFE